MKCTFFISLILSVTFSVEISDLDKFEAINPEFIAPKGDEDKIDAFIYDHTRWKDAIFLDVNNDDNHEIFFNVGGLASNGSIQGPIASNRDSKWGSWAFIYPAKDSRRLGEIMPQNIYEIKGANEEKDILFIKKKNTHIHEDVTFKSIEDQPLDYEVSKVVFEPNAREYHKSQLDYWEQSGYKMNFNLQSRLLQLSGKELLDYLKGKTLNPADAKLERYQYVYTVQMDFHSPNGQIITFEPDADIGEVAKVWEQDRYYNTTLFTKNGSITYDRNGNLIKTEPRTDNNTLKKVLEKEGVSYEEYRANNFIKTRTVSDIQASSEKEADVSELDIGKTNQTSGSMIAIIIIVFSLLILVVFKKLKTTKA